MLILFEIFIVIPLLIIASIIDLILDILGVIVITVIFLIQCIIGFFKQLFEE